MADSRDPPPPSPPTGVPGSSTDEGGLQDFVSRVLLLVPLALATWAGFRGMRHGVPVGYLTLLIAASAVLIVGERRPLTAAAAMTAAAVLEWLAAGWLSKHSPLPFPLGSFLLATLLLILIEIPRPTRSPTDLIDSISQGERQFWRLIVLAVSVLGVFLAGFALSL